jgi:DNA mismatch repair protein MutS
MVKDIKQAKNKISITDEYFSYHEKYIGKYGPNSIVLLEVGSFYEMYSNPLNNKGPDLCKIGNILNLLVSRKDKTIPLSDSNVLMCGIIKHSISKYLKLLIDNNYFVIIFNEHKINKIFRKLEEINSKIDNSIIKLKIIYNFS